MRRASLVALGLLVAPAAAQPVDPFTRSSIADWTAPPPPTAELRFSPPAARRSTRLAWMLALLWSLNLADLALTHKALAGGAVEANAVVNAFLRLGFVWGGVFKVGLVTVGVLFLWHERRRPIVYRGAVVLAVVYVLVVVYQIVGLTTIA